MDWKNVKFYRDKTWKAERWTIVEYDNGSAEPKMVGYWYGTFTVKHNDYEDAIIKKNPHFTGVYDITLKCTGTDTPEYIDENDYVNGSNSIGSLVGKSGTYLMQVGISAPMGDVPFVTLYKIDNPVSVNETYLWDPAQYNKSKARNMKVRK